jgi:transcriptional regulator with XRE-family HTH domain
MISKMRAKRFFRELSLYELGQQTNIDASRLSLIERRFKRPSAEEAQRIAEVLNCAPGDLFEGYGGG